ncbi:MAG: serine hydroxymethyltransferase [Parvibaculum sp.]|nr:serine hydroxymethyltransferase [Parvibaculum sp.]
MTHSSLLANTPDRRRLAVSDPDILNALTGEEARQRAGLELIPSENYAFPEVLTLLGSVFTNKYAEGYPGRRYYGGQDYTDAIETLARNRAKALFRAEHANVQPLSGSPMNQAVYLGLLNPGDTILAMDLSHGGHLTHGAPVSHMGRLFNFVRYKTDPTNGAIDFAALAQVARETRPKMIVCGYSSYPRDYDYADFKRVADEVGALTMADVSHIGGLIAADVMRNPLDAGFDVMTTTTHKSLRGPRGGLILCKEQHAKAIDASVFPGLQGGPHMNQVAAAATTFRLAALPAFRAYALNVLGNAKALAGALTARQVRLVTGGTDNHLLVINTVQSFGIDGAKAQAALDRVGLTTNKQIIPDDPLPPMRPSGIRIGTPAATARGFGLTEMDEVAAIITETLIADGDAATEANLLTRTEALTSRFPVPGL